MLRLTDPDRPMPAPPGTYWVSPGRLLAGRYPKGITPEETKGRLLALEKHGIQYIVDLTEVDELYTAGARVQTYAIQWIKCGSKKSAKSYIRHPIQDYGTPKKVAPILRSIDDAIRKGLGVYVHCRAGVGRTGTIVSCWMLRHGLVSSETVQERLDEIRGAYFVNPRQSPDVGWQRRYCQIYGDNVRRLFLEQDAGLRS